ncbi:hypothetical protein Q6261_26340, partial [Klebsiella pneumoniae]|uniref:hypothetical protein n=1 Tax=Klebsiella pneumoniae TaxID=573 RepID=UPI00273043AB
GQRTHHSNKSPPHTQKFNLHAFQYQEIQHVGLDVKKSKMITQINHYLNCDKKILTGQYIKIKQLSPKNEIKSHHSRRLTNTC